MPEEENNSIEVSMMNALLEQYWIWRLYSKC